MRKENSPILMLLAGAAVIVVLLYLISQPSNKDKDQSAVTPPTSPVPTTPPAGQTGDSPQDSFNPDYKNLSKDDIAIADIAIGKLLNSVQGINPSMISVRSFEAVDFPSTALGCPEEGKSYSEVITPGHKIVLEAQGKEYDYRVAGQENVVLCKQ